MGRHVFIVKKDAKKQKRPDAKHQVHSCYVVGMIGFEPMVFCSQSRRDNQASLHPEALLFSAH